MKCGDDGIHRDPTLKGLNLNVLRRGSTLSGLEKRDVTFPAFHTGLFKFSHFVVL